MEPTSGVPRYTFGVIEMMQGVTLVPVAVGLFGLAEVLLVAEQAGRIALHTQSAFQGVCSQAFRSGSNRCHRFSVEDC